MPRLRALVILGAVLAALLWAAPAHACTPPPGGLPTYTTAEHVAAAPLVFEGTVLAVSGQSPQTATLLVTQYIKGIGPQTIAVSGYGPASICLSEVFIQKTGLFFASGDEASGYTAFYLSQFDAILTNDPQIIRDAIGASGQEPRTDFTLYTVGTPDAVMTEAMATAWAQATPPAWLSSAYPFGTPTPWFAVYFPPPPTSQPQQIVSRLDAVSATALLMLGSCLGLLMGALLGAAVGFRLGRRK